MLIDLNDLFKKNNYNKELDLDFDLDKFQIKSDLFKIKQKSLLHLSLFHHHDRKFSAKGNITLVLGVPCDRCLEETDVKFDISFSREFDLEREEISDEDGKEFDENKFISENNELLIDKIIEEELLINWPDKVVCKEDCKGLCQVCGHNLNVSDCGCDRVVLDPRMAAIQDIFKNTGN